MIGGGYTIIFLFFRKRLSRTGKELQTYSKRMYKALNESFGGIKDIKLLGKEKVFINQYADPAKGVIDCYCSRFLISQFPRYAFEAMAFGGILLITVYIAVIRKDYQQIIPLVGLYALAALRLMPALQQIFNDFTLIRFGHASLETIYHDFSNCLYKEEKRQREPVEALSFFKNIELRHVSFKYPKAQNSVIEDLNFNIKVNTTVWICWWNWSRKNNSDRYSSWIIMASKGRNCC